VEEEDIQDGNMRARPGPGNPEVFDDKRKTSNSERGDAPLPGEELQKTAHSALPRGGNRENPTGGNHTEWGTHSDDQMSFRVRGGGNAEGRNVVPISTRTYWVRSGGNLGMGGAGYFESRTIKTVGWWALELASKGHAAEKKKGVPRMWWSEIGL